MRAGLQNPARDRGHFRGRSRALAPTRAPSQSTTLPLGNATDSTDSLPTVPTSAAPNARPEPLPAPEGAALGTAGRRKVPGDPRPEDSKARRSRGPVPWGRQWGSAPQLWDAAGTPAAPPSRGQHKPEVKGKQKAEHYIFHRQKNCSVLQGWMEMLGCQPAPPVRRTLLCSVLGRGASTAPDGAWAEQPLRTRSLPKSFPFAPRSLHPSSGPSPARQRAGSYGGSSCQAFINTHLLGRSLGSLLSHSFSRLEYSLQPVAGPPIHGACTGPASRAVEQPNRASLPRKRRVTEPWPRLPREAVESPSLEIFQPRLDKVLYSLL